MEKIAEIKDHIGIYEGFFSKEFCEKTIAYFEHRLKHISSPEQLNAVNGVYRRTGAFVTDNAVSIGNEDDYERTILARVGECPMITADFQTVFWQEVYPHYTSHYPAIPQTSRHMLGTTKIQRTVPSEGYHTWHFENASKMVWQRIAFVILYLNTVEDGGETEFLHQSLRIKPTQGTLVIAPASYTHTHRGNPPLKDSKYIMTTWMEYQE